MRGIFLNFSLDVPKNPCRVSLISFTLVVLKYTCTEEARRLSWYLLWCVPLNIVWRLYT